jgi:hypothetical protein
MTIALGLLIATLTTASAGFGVTMLIARARPSISECFALTWLFGTAAVSLSLWTGGLLLRAAALQMTVTVICLALGGLGLYQWRRFPATRRASSLAGIEIVFIALFALEWISMFWLSFHRVLEWDGLFVFEVKARYAFLNGGVVPTSFFRDVPRSFTNPSYPLLLPLTETWFYLWMGDCNQFWIRLIFPLWYGCAMLLLLLASEDLTGSRLIAWIVVLLFPLVPIVHDRGGGFQSGFCDAPLSTVYLGTIFYLLRFVRDGSRQAMAFFIALGATLPWLKPEGVILWVVVSIFGAAAIRKWQDSWPTVTLAFLPGLGVISLWMIFLAAVHALPERDFAIHLATLHNSFQRTGGVLFQFFIELFRRDWDIFWLLPAGALVAVVRRRNKCELMTACFLVIPLLCYCAGYIFSAVPDYRWHMKTSLGRHSIDLVPVAWLLIALAMAPPRNLPVKTEEK